MTEEHAKEIAQEEPGPISFAEFLEDTPPSSLTEISDVAEAIIQYGEIKGYRLSKPEIQIHCPEDTCNGTRFFRCTTKETIYLSDEDFKFTYIEYVCSNCRITKKTFSLAVTNNEKEFSGRAYKFGELPVYGPPTPSKLIKLIGPDRDIFLKGRRCENQGLGIGSFVYYRRVVENQKNRILDEIIKVSKKLNVSEDTIKTLTEAKIETQFSKALSMVKDAIPQSLLINGHNPLTLLHSALSDGLHDQTDEHCLGIASSVRIVLGDLSERLSQALKDEVELNNAISKLLKNNNKNKS